MPATGLLPAGGFGRDAEHATLVAALERAARGEGRLVLVEGAPGIGKTCLLESASTLADATGHLVLRACGVEFERDFPFGVARQLLEVSVRSLDDARVDALREGAAALAFELFDAPGAVRLRSKAEPTVGLLHGIYWLTLELAAEAPLLLLVDDAQWADGVSLRALAYLARRLDGAPVTIMAAARERAWQPGSPLAELFAVSGASRIVLRPLEVQGTASLVGALIGRPVEAEVARACHAAAGGNPFLVSELVRAASSDGGLLTVDAVERIELLAPESLVRALVARLGSLSQQAGAVAQAVSILGDGTPARVAAAFAALTLEETIAAADALIAAGVFGDRHELSFAHPLVRAAIYGELSAVARGDGHRRAASLLHAEGAGSERVATQLLASLPAADPGTAELLAAAGVAASERGAFDAAVRLLARALAEPPASDRIGEVLLALGRAELAAGDRERAAQDLRAALHTKLPPDSHVAGALALAQSVDGREAIELLERSTAVLDGEHALRLDIERSSIALYSLERTAEGFERMRSYSSLAGETAIERLALAELAFARWSERGATAESVAQTAELALGDDRLIREQTGDATACFHATLALLGCEHFDAVARQVELLFDDARTRGSRFAFFAASCAASASALLTGDLAGAIAHGEAGVDAARELATSPVAATGPWIARPTLALLARGDLEEAARLLIDVDREQIVPMSSWFVDLSRGHIALARGDHEHALQAFLTHRDGAAKAGHESRLTRWRLGAARAAAALGRTDDAIAHADAQLALDRVWGAPGGLGDALRVRAVVGDPQEACERLTEAVAVLRTSDCRLALARALVDLGVAQRRARQRVESRATLTEGLDLATACGARPLAERARAELRIAGARPRRDRITGRDALTPSEQRIATLAAGGRTNRQIAQELFLTPKTIEQHLTAIYRKLNVTGRANLPQALGAGAL